MQPNAIQRAHMSRLVGLFDDLSPFLSDVMHV